MEIIRLSLCRLCAQCRGPDKIIGQINSTELDIESKLIACCQWNVFEGAQSNEMPQNVCISCYTDLNKSWSFAERVRCAQIELHSKLTTQNIASGSEIKIESNFHDDDNEETHLNSTAQSSYVDLKEEVEMETFSPLSLAHICDYDSGEQRDVLDDFDCAENDEEPSTSANDIVNVMVDDIDSKKSKSATELNESSFLKSIGKSDRNADGSIKLEAIQRLGIDNWSVIQYKCYLCKLQLPDQYEWRSHIKVEHPGQPYRHLCNICNQKDYTSRKPLLNHVVSNHRRCFKFW